MKSFKIKSINHITFQQYVSTCSTSKKRNVIFNYRTVLYFLLESLVLLVLLIRNGAKYHLYKTLLVKPVFNFCGVQMLIHSEKC